MGVEIHVKNQLGNGLSIQFCCGEREYELKPEEEIAIEVQEGDCLYLDVVS